MRLSRAFGKTLREAPADAEMVSHQLLIRANFIRPVGAGIYTFMPFGYRVLQNMWRIIAEEMDAIGGQEFWMPNLHPMSLWQATGRAETVDVLFEVAGGHGRDYALSPTHEEVVVDLALREIESHRDLPQLIYHISKKFRNEQRARGGLVRLREFVMKDAYSLDTDEAALDAFYPSMVQAYFNIFERCGVDVTDVAADVGAMGGKTSHEFVVPHEQGEDLFIACDSCDYAANDEAAEFVREGTPPAELAELTEVATPDCKTIADVAAFLGVETSQTVKAVFSWWTPPPSAEIAPQLLFSLVRGDLDVNETKLLNQLGGGTLRPATEDEIAVVGAVAGYASAVGLQVAPSLSDEGVIVIGDLSLQAGGNFVVGANSAEAHFTGANYPRDFAVTQLADIAKADTGHRCPRCDGRLEARRAIEAGHCFKLGTRYSSAVGATYLDETGQAQPIFMGSYGIGLDRLMAIVVESHHDADGIIWPDAIAPYQVHLMSLGKGEEVREAAETWYERLTRAGLSVLYDDRNVSAGVKFKDADLIGVPTRVAIGKRGLAAGSAEVKRRDSDERLSIPFDELIDWLTQF